MQGLAKYKQLLLISAVTCCFAACKQIDVFEKNTSIPQYQWQYGFEPGFDFDIKDTSLPYQIYIVLRHNDAYRYNNIWLNLSTLAPGDSAARKQRVDLQLASDDKGWEGTGLDDIWEVRKPVTHGPVHFSKTGRYHFSVAQIMRENPLPNVMSIGLRVERSR